RRTRCSEKRGRPRGGQEGPDRRRIGRRARRVYLPSRQQVRREPYLMQRLICPKISLTKRR
ncbi:UNVERIFIED_CONTAM: hypothetical protein GTU68_018113, partial [Idotea baltica]|nr:hypothetical protein [Idotea baltica]